MNFFSKDEKIELNVTGMSCGHCEARVKEALLNIKGVKKAAADHQAQKAVVTVEKDKVGRKDLAAAVEAAGYGAS
ncbi:MAG: heavy-metal-associated domain-containing protein [Deltaproteobacteria bacterium]|nr:heavy-metal-associated domain-containing protein [Deltaproteobacteria bacterium]MBW2050652.1 heavy-metal-associated domain-containing protein [Deltaproteobacteria bacterium]MBW2139454.1 heavy-metal-associated domain-containing protein [Deltaproteobacteria bacterium]MBW2324019.1 heavy-metal-associated domain-containing protein [Deltaproteobacteria bacterium]